MQRLNFMRIFGAVVLVSHLLLVDGLTGNTFAVESPASKKTIAIVEFAVRGDGLDPQAGAIIADSLTSAIANIGNFALKDRISLSAIAKLAKKIRWAPSVPWTLKPQSVGNASMGSTA